MFRKQEVNMKIKRDIYLDRLIRREKNGLIKIVTGVRRCGKSYLLFNLFHNYLLEKGVREDHIIEITLDDRSNKELRDPDNMLKYVKERIVDKDTYYIILDEVQLLAEFEDVLNSYLHVENAEVYVTGSNARFLSKDVITEFRGRGWEIRIHPLSFSEYYEVVGGEERQALENYYLYGGLPAVAQIETPEAKQNYLREIYETVYLKDVLERNRLKSPEGMKELVRLLASTIGSCTNVLKISNTFKSVGGVDISVNTISKYLEYLQDSFVISEALRYDVKGRKYISAGTKYYFEDIGIRNAVVDFRQIEYTHIMENVIYNELRKQGYSVDVGVVESFKRDEHGKLQRRNLEIDFVVNRHDERLYIQSAFALPDKEKVDQEQASLLNVNDGFRKLIIVGDRYRSGYNEEGILMMSLSDFLLGKGGKE